MMFLFLTLSYALICVKEQCKISGAVNFIPLRPGDILILGKDWLKVEEIALNCSRVDLLDVANVTVHVPEPARHCPKQGFCSAKTHHNEPRCKEYWTVYDKQFGSNIIKRTVQHKWADRIKGECNCLKGGCYGNQVCVDYYELKVKSNDKKLEIMECKNYKIKTNSTTVYMRGEYNVVVGALYSGDIIANYDKTFQGWKLNKEKDWKTNETPLYPAREKLDQDMIPFVTEGEVCKNTGLKECKNIELVEFSETDCKNCEFKIKADANEIPCIYENIRISCNEMQFSKETCQDVHFKSETKCKRLQQQSIIESYEDWFQEQTPEPKTKLKTWQIIGIVILAVIVTGLVVTILTTLGILLIVITLKCIPLISGVLVQFGLF